jgi:hypothetical protein
MNKLTETLVKLETYLSNCRPDLYTKLLPGLSIQEVENIAKDIPFQLPLEVHELYQWHNGINVEYESKDEFFPNERFFAPLSYCVQRYFEFRDLGLSEEFVNPLWFPLIDSDGHSYFCTGSNEKIKSSPIVFLTTHDDWDFVECYDSLEGMILTILECFETEVYYYEDGIINSLELKEDLVRAKYNPNTSSQ